MGELAAINEGGYGFAYARFSNFQFTDNVGVNDVLDQADFRRLRLTLGFGGGYTEVGDDGFTWGFSLAVGRHVVNEYEFAGRRRGEPYPVANDAEIFTMPFDVYARIYLGFRQYSDRGREARERLYGEIKAEHERRREAIQRVRDPEYPNLSEREALELRRELHRLRNGDG